jgi:hypothetical protein
LNVEEFEKNIFKPTIKKLEQLLEKKGYEYREGESNDIHANFNNEAKKLDVSSFLILSVYMNKHISSIMTYIKDRVHNRPLKSYSEPIEGRILDLINYMMLLLGMIKEFEDKDRQNLKDQAKEMIKLQKQINEKRKSLEE